MHSLSPTEAFENECNPNGSGDPYPVNRSRAGYVDRGGCVSQQRRPWRIFLWKTALEEVLGVDLDRVARRERAEGLGEPRVRPRTLRAGVAAVVILMSVEKGG